MQHKTFASLFIETSKKFPDRVALREKDLGIWQEVTWREYYEHVRYFSLGLISMGFEKGSKLSILGDGCREWLYADLAAQCAGGTSVGVYPTNPPSEVKYVVSHSESTFIVVKDQEQADKVIEVKDQLPHLKRIIVIDFKGLRKYSQPYLMRFEEVEALGMDLERNNPGLFEKRLNDIKPEDIAFFIYTSGTTGPPKGVMISHRAILSSVDSLSEVFNLGGKKTFRPRIPFFWRMDKYLTISEKDCVLSYLPLCHIAEKMMSLLFACKVGYAVNFTESLDTVNPNLREISPTFFLTVPRILEKLHSNILIKIDESSWLKKICYKISMPIGKKITRDYLLGEKVGGLGQLLYAIEYLFVSRSIQRFLGLSYARNIISGGAAIAPELVEFFLAIGVPVRHCFGASESAGLLTYNMAQILSGSSGMLVPGVEIKIDQTGEVMVRCKSLFSGYYKDPEATSYA
ncbi:MAG: AMP-binding protein, partial [Thermodesulfobacteriota bacterium]|nr:AMP-binding protein [Thermodesulfobacteriota bacterium]